MTSEKIYWLETVHIETIKSKYPPPLHRHSKIFRSNQRLPRGHSGNHRFLTAVVACLPSSPATGQTASSQLFPRPAMRKHLLSSMHNCDSIPAVIPKCDLLCPIKEIAVASRREIVTNTSFSYLCRTRVVHAVSIILSPMLNSKHWFWAWLERTFGRVLYIVYSLLRIISLMWVNVGQCLRTVPNYSMLFLDFFVHVVAVTSVCFLLPFMP